MRSILLAVGLIWGGTASAAELITSTAAQPDHLTTEMGSAVTAGGGVAVQDEETGGTWAVRGIYGTRSIIGVEGAYVGTARELTDDRMLLSNGGEIALRAGLPIGMDDDNRTVVTPFLYGGVGYAWTEVSVEGDNPRDDGAYIPAGGGIAVSYDQFYIDARASWREPLVDNLPGGGSDGSLLLSANVGAEF